MSLLIFLSVFKRPMLRQPDFRYVNGAYRLRAAKPRTFAPVAAARNEDCVAARGNPKITTLEYGAV